jgi:hypothetical protein
VELFDPAAMTWSNVAAVDPPLRELALAPPADGRVLATGRDRDAAAGSRFIARLYDPATDRWTAAVPPPIELDHHSLTVLGDGRVLASGAYDGRNAVFDAALEGWESLLDSGLFGPVAVTSLPSGRVVIAGGAPP